MPSFKVIIVGGGLAGCLLANGLANNDCDVVLYERDRREAKREGYQIRLGAPALIGFRQCLKEDQIASIVAKFGRSGGKTSSAPVWRDRDFNCLLDLSRQPMYTKSAPINRAILRNALAEPLERKGVINYDKNLLHYEILTVGPDLDRVRVFFEDGSFDDGDVLIGADGSGSKINYQVGLRNISQIESHISFICKSSLPYEKLQVLPSETLKDPVITFSDNRTFYFATYLPSKPGEGKSSPVHEDLQDYDETAASCMFGLHLPVDSVDPDLAKQSPEAKWKACWNGLSGWDSRYQQILQAVTGEDMYVYQSRASSKPASGWREKARARGSSEQGHGRVWLIGDAMHAMLASRGMGGNQAMRDTATALPFLLDIANSARKGRVSNRMVTKACDDYEAEMIPRSFYWVQKSGGGSAVPIDTATLKGKIALFFLARALDMAYIWYLISSLFSRKTIVDDAPEFRD